MAEPSLLAGEVTGPPPVADLRPPTLGDPSGLTTMVLGGHPRWVHLHARPTSLTVRSFNLNLVCHELHAAGVGYFVVPGLEDRASVVGVRDSERRDAFHALGRLFERHVGYVSSRLPAPRVHVPAHRGNRRATWEDLAEAQVLRLTWYRSDDSRTLVLGQNEACDVEFWTERDGRLYAPRPNRVAPSVDAESPRVLVHANDFSRLAPAAQVRERRLASIADFSVARPDEIVFPIDAVYTWVDGSDPAWLAKRANVTDQQYHEESGSAARFLSRDELRYSLRSLHANAPWVRKIWLVTDDQRPSWLVEDDRLSVVDHRDIFSDPAALPTFNSHSIESQLHHIEGLAEHFIYFNDDMFLGRPLSPHTFFLPNGLTRIFYSQSRVPMDPLNDGDTPVDAALKNNRELIRTRFGRTISQTFKHTPYVLRRSILDEIEHCYPAAHDQTMRNKVRSTGDISIPSCLHHYFALLSARAVPSDVRYSYTQLAVPDLGERLARLLERRDVDTFCLNDAYTLDSEIEGQVAVLAPFLEAYFPVPSPWEKR